MAPPSDCFFTYEILAFENENLISQIIHSYSGVEMMNQKCNQLLDLFSGGRFMRNWLDISKGQKRMDIQN